MFSSWFTVTLVLAVVSAATSFGKRDATAVKVSSPLYTFTFPSSFSGSLLPFSAPVLSLSTVTRHLFPSPYLQVFTDTVTSPTQADLTTISNGITNLENAIHAFSGPNPIKALACVSLPTRTVCLF